MSSLSLNVSPLSFARGTAAALGLLGVTVAARGLLDPAEAAVTFGFPRSTTTATTAKSNPWVSIASGRALSGSLGVLALVYLRFDRALGVLLCTGVVTSVFDGLNLVKDPDFVERPSQEVVDQVSKEQKAKAWGHFGIISITFPLGLYLFAHGEI